MGTVRNDFTKIVRERDLYRDNELRKAIEALLINYDSMSRLIYEQIEEVAKLKEIVSLQDLKLKLKYLDDEVKLINFISHHFNESLENIRGGSSKANAVFCRQLMASILRAEKVTTLQMIARYLKLSSHQQLINNIRGFKFFYKNDEAYKNKVQHFILKYYDQILLDKIDNYVKHEKS